MADIKPHNNGMIFSESFGGKYSHRRYLVVGDTVRRSDRGNSGIGIKERGVKILKEAFLPQGYPNSVSDDYLQYQIWDTIQAFCSYITGTLATQAVLKGVGVGDSSASPIAATITWLLKDGLGMIGRIVFAWLKGTDLDCNAKKWRLVADILNDIALCLDLLAPIFPVLFMTIICASSVTKSIVGVAGGATRAAIVQHQARRDNMADVSAKDGSQETMVNLAGLIVGLILTPTLAGKTGLIWLLFLMFTMLHLFANYQAVSVVSMETFNKNRLHLLMKGLLSTGSVSSPKVINSLEPVLRECQRKFHIRMGVPLSQVLRNSTDYEMASRKAKAGQKFIMNLSIHNTISIAFHNNSTSRDQIQAVVAAEIFEYIHHKTDISQNKFLSRYVMKINRLIDLNGLSNELMSLAEEISNDIFIADLLDEFHNKGWVTSHHLLHMQEWRYSLEL